MIIVSLFPLYDRENVKIIILALKRVLDFSNCNAIIMLLYYSKDPKIQ